VSDHRHFAGVARWQAIAFLLGISLAAAGLLVMLMTALRSFGAAELLGQASSVSCKVHCAWHNILNLTVPKTHPDNLFNIVTFHVCTGTLWHSSYSLSSLSDTSRTGHQHPYLSL